MNRVNMDMWGDLDDLHRWLMISCDELRNNYTEPDSDMCDTPTDLVKVRIWQHINYLKTLDGEGLRRIYDCLDSKRWTQSDLNCYDETSKYYIDGTEDYLAPHYDEHGKLNAYSKFMDWLDRACKKENGVRSNGACNQQ